MTVSGRDGRPPRIGALAHLVRTDKFNVTGVSATSLSAVNAALFGLALDRGAPTPIDPERLLWPPWRDAQFEHIYPGDATCAEYAARTDIPFECTDDRPYDDRDELATQAFLRPIAEVLNGVQAGRWEAMKEDTHGSGARSAGDGGASGGSTAGPLDIAIHLTATRPRKRKIAGNDAEIWLRIFRLRLEWTPHPRFISARETPQSDGPLTDVWLPGVRTPANATDCTSDCSASARDQRDQFVVPGAVVEQVFRASAAFPMFSAPRPLSFCADDCRPQDVVTHGGLSCPDTTQLCSEPFTDGLTYGRVPLTGAVELADRQARDLAAKGFVNQRPRFKFVVVGNRGRRAARASRVAGDLLNLRGAAYYSQYVADIVETGSDTEASASLRHRFRASRGAGPIDPAYFDRAGVTLIERSPVTADFPFLSLPAGLPFMRSATAFLDPAFRRFDYLTGRLDAIAWWKDVAKGDFDDFDFADDAGYRLLQTLRRWRTTQAGPERDRLWGEARALIADDPDAHALYLVWAAVVTCPGLELHPADRRRLLGDEAPVKACIDALPGSPAPGVTPSDTAAGMLCRLGAAEYSSPEPWCECAAWNRSTSQEGRFRRACFSHRPWRTLRDQRPAGDTDYLGDLLEWRQRIRIELAARGEAVEARADGFGRVPLAAFQAVAAHHHMWATTDWGWHHSTIPHRIQQSGTWAGVTQLVAPTALNYRLTDGESEGTEDDAPKASDFLLDWSLIHGRRNSDAMDTAGWAAAGLSLGVPATDGWSFGFRGDVAASWDRLATISDLGARVRLLKEYDARGEGQWRWRNQAFVRTLAGHLELAFEPQDGLSDWQFIVGITDLGGLVYWIGRLAGVDMTGPDMLERAGVSPL